VQAGTQPNSKLNFKEFLDRKVALYNQPSFIADDPVSVPHWFSHKQDIEIAGFWAAMLAWGQRVTIINKCKELFTLMDMAPHQFMLHHQEADLKALTGFKHRTFNTTDTLYFVHFLSWFYRNHTSLEEAFCRGITPESDTVEAGLVNFHRLFFSLPDAPQRTKKHVATPERKSACKRINMFLRWMVRQDDQGIDFGLWQRIQPAQLVCPCDLHVERVARRMGLITRKQADWATALELTYKLRQFDAADPVKYDFALFGLGIVEKM